MSKKISLFLLISIISFIKSDIYKNRHNNYTATYDCLGEGKGENDKGAAGKILIPEDCFDESPFRKYECCYFEYKKDDGSWKTGCMKIYKGDEEDLNDLKYYVSKLSKDTVFNCRQIYLEFNLIFGILISFVIVFS